MTTPPTFRCVEAHHLYEKPLTFRTLCIRHVPQHTTHIVLDLDRTIHLRHNLSELVGWELTLQAALGESLLEKLEDSRGEGRRLVGWTRPVDSLVSLVLGAKHWADVARIYYYWLHSPFGVQRSKASFYATFGAEPVRAVQRLAQSRLFGLLADTGRESIERAIRRVLHRHRNALAIEPSDIAWLNQRYPDAQILLCSAAPKPIVSVTADYLGIKRFIAASVPEDVAGFATPVYEVLHVKHLPRKLAVPKSISFNAGREKIERLRAEVSGWNATESHCVGITDTSHGDDHSWTEAFDTVVDVNSNSPFSPLVGAADRVKEVVSVSLMSRREKVKLAMGEDARVHDECRHSGYWKRRDLRCRFAPTLARLDALGVQRHYLASTPSRTLTWKLQEAHLYLDVLVERYNEVSAAQKQRLLPTLRNEVKKALEVERELARKASIHTGFLAEIDMLRRQARSAIGAEIPPHSSHQVKVSEPSMDLHEVALSAAL